MTAFILLFEQNKILKSDTLYTQSGLSKSISSIFFTIRFIKKTAFSNQAKLAYHGQGAVLDPLDFLANFLEGQFTWTDLMSHITCKMPS